MIALLENHRDEIARLCQRFGVRQLDVFGSAASGNFKAATSDVDFIASFSDTGPGYADRFLGFAEAIEMVFGRKVDLLTEAMIQNPIFRREIESTRQRIYEQRSEQAAA